MLLKISQNHKSVSAEKYFFNTLGFNENYTYENNFFVLDTQTEKMVFKSELIKTKACTRKIPFQCIVEDSKIKTITKEEQHNCSTAIRNTFFDKSGESILQIDILIESYIHNNLSRKIFTVNDSKTSKQIIPNLVDDKEFEYSGIKIIGDFIIAEIDKVRSKCKKSKDGDMGSNIYDLKGNLLFSQVDYFDVYNNRYLILSFVMDREGNNIYNFKKKVYDYTKKKFITLGNLQCEQPCLQCKYDNYTNCEPCYSDIEIYKDIIISDEFPPCGVTSLRKKVYDIEGNLLFDISHSDNHMEKSGDFLIYEKTRDCYCVYDIKNKKNIIPENINFSPYVKIKHINNYFIAYSKTYLLSFGHPTKTDPLFDIYDEKGNIVLENVKCSESDILNCFKEIQELL